MRKMTAVLLIISVVAEHLQITKYKNIPGLQNNLFHKTNENLQNTMNKLFTSLKISKNFNTKDKTQLLLTIHSSLKNIAENKFKIYKEIEKNSKVDVDNKTEERLFHLKDMVEEILNENNFILSNTNTVVHKFSNTDMNSINMTSTKCNEITEETLEPNKMNVISLEIQKTLNNTRVEKKVIGSRRFMRGRKIDNLKLWRPSNETDEYNQTRRIYEGKSNHYPFIVSIHMRDQFMCAGSIISRDLVITAATCMQIAYNTDFSPGTSSLSIRVGSDYTAKSGAVLLIIAVHFHPFYDSKFLKNNLAIGKMSKSLQFNKSNRNIRRIEYDRREGKLPDNVEVTMLGWGDKFNKVVSFNQLLSVANLDLYNMEDCTEIYSREYVTDRNFCAGFVTKGSGDCNRDVGGPGIVGGELVGVVSFGPPVCGTSDAPTVFTKLGRYAHWIDNIIKQESTVALKHTLTTKKPVTEGIKYPFRAHLKVQNKKNKPASYPKEIMLLKSVIKQVVRAGQYNIEDLLYGDVDDNETEFWIRSTPNINHPVLENQDRFQTLAGIVTTEPSMLDRIFESKKSVENLDAPKSIHDILDEIEPAREGDTPTNIPDSSSSDLMFEEDCMKNKGIANEDVQIRSTRGIYMKFSNKEDSKVLDSDENNRNGNSNIKSEGKFILEKKIDRNYSSTKGVLSEPMIFKVKTNLELIKPKIEITGSTKIGGNNKDFSDSSTCSQEATSISEDSQDDAQSQTSNNTSSEGFSIEITGPPKTFNKTYANTKYKTKKKITIRNTKNINRFLNKK